MNAHELGKWGEEQADRFLISKGYIIRERNYRALRGEIDIIAMDGSVLVFVEVKARRGTAHGLPAEAVTPAKQRICIRTALHYMQRYSMVEHEVRFDVIEVLYEGSQWHIRHIPNAFVS